MTSKAEILALAARYEELEAFEQACYDAYDAIIEAQQLCPHDIAFSHHAEMEISDCISQVENLLQEIADKVNQ